MNSIIPKTWQEIEDVGMSNFDHLIDSGLDEALRKGDVYAQHAAWDFNGLVWYDKESGEFKEEVWRYNTPVEVFSAPTLLELMEAVNDKWGWK